MSADRPRCMVIDGHPTMRLGIRALLEDTYEVDEPGDGREATELLTNVGGYELAIVEMRASGANKLPSGSSTIRKLLSAQPAIGVVAFGGSLERHAVREAMDAGALAYVSSQSPSETLEQAVAAVGVGEHYLDPALGTRAAIGVTKRQRQVLQLFADGLSTEQVASRLGLSAETVRTHAKASLGRLGARDRTHAVALAIRGSLIE